MIPPSNHSAYAESKHKVRPNSSLNVDAVEDLSLGKKAKGADLARTISPVARSLPSLGLRMSLIHESLIYSSHDPMEAAEQVEETTDNPIHEMQITRSLFNALKPRVAVLYQAVEPPIINGVRKPAKPGGE